MGAGASTGKKRGAAGSGDAQTSKRDQLFGPDVAKSGFKIGLTEKVEPIQHKKERMSSTESGFWRAEINEKVYIITFQHETIMGAQSIIANGKQLHHCMIKFKLVGEIDFMMENKICKIDMRFKRSEKTRLHHWVYALFINGVKIPRLERLKTLHLWTVDVDGAEYEIQFEEESMKIYVNRDLMNAEMGFADVGSAYKFQLKGRQLELNVRPTKDGMSVDLLVDGRVWPKLPQSAHCDLDEIQRGIAKCNSDTKRIRADEVASSNAAAARVKLRAKHKAIASATKKENDGFFSRFRVQSRKQKKAPDSLDAEQKPQLAAESAKLAESP